MNLEEARELMNKLNHGDPDSGVGKATSVKTWKTELRTDADRNPLSAERVDEAEFPLGHIGPASPCCAAPEGEHTPECPARSVDDDTEAH